MNKIKEHLDDSLKELKVDGELREEILKKTVYAGERKEESRQNNEENTKESRRNNGENTKESMKSRTENKGIRSKQKGRNKFRGIGAAAAVIVFCLTTLTVAGAEIPALQYWLHQISPDLAEFLYPVTGSCEKNGIRVSVIAGVNDEHHADIYFTIQDTEGKTRTVSKADFMDSAGIDGGSISNVEFISYDESTQTALYVLHESGGRNWANRRNTFRIGSMMFRKRTIGWFETGISLGEDIPLNGETFPLNEYGYSGGSVAEGEMELLKADVMDISLGEDIDFMTISNLGIVDGKLHIQTKWDTSFDNHGEFWLLKKGRTPEEYEDSVPQANYYFNTEEDEEKTGGGRFAKHVEFVYETESLESLEDYSLWARVIEDGEIVKGSWEVDFFMEDMEKITILDSELAEEIQITPVGVSILNPASISGESFQGAPGEYEAFVKMKDGSVIPLNTRMTYEGEPDETGRKKWEISFLAEQVLEIDEIEEIRIDGEKISVERQE